jgi:hypothetical protein
VAEVAKANGYKDIFRQSLITLTEMERLMGKSKFEKILGDLIYKPPASQRWFQIRISGQL